METPKEEAQINENLKQLLESHQEKSDLVIELGDKEQIIIKPTDDFEVPEIEEVLPETVVPERKKRAVPKKILENQKKYMEALEKQQRLKSPSKNKTACKKTVEPVTTEPVDKTGMVRMVVNGRVKYISVNQQAPTENKDLPVKKSDESITVSESPVIVPEPIEVPMLSRKPKGSIDDILNDKETSHSRTHGKLSPQEETPLLKTSELSPQGEIAVEKPIKRANGRMPDRYAKQIEKDVKKTTIKNVKTFSDLRRVRTMEDLQVDSTVDLNRVSMNELRRMKMEQKKREALANKHKQNKTESQVQTIMNDEKMSKFSKMIAVNNLAVNSRHKKKPALGNI